jgi:signal transduction histidine kinase
MTIFSSLRSRVFMASALLAVLSIAVALYLVNVRLSGQLERQLQREIMATGAIVEQLGTTQAQQFTMMARLIADAPKLKAAVDTNDPATVQDTLDGYQSEVHSHLLVVTNRDGMQLASVGVGPAVATRLAALPSVREATSGKETSALLPQQDGVLQLVSVPIVVGIDRPDLLGTLSVGFLFDAALAARVKEITGSDIAFGLDGKILAATVSLDVRRSLTDLLAGRTDAGDRSMLETAGFVALPLQLPAQRAGSGDPGPMALILRSKQEQRELLGSIQNQLILTAFLAVLLATILSFAVARTITRPLTEITGKMREVAATGDLTRKILPGQAWQDADAKLLATTFNMLTDSIARAQREMSQKERLSSLGRLSTVIAHEVRNPLMIIKAAVHSIRQPDASPAAVAEAAADIDGEIVRLNRIVNEVLDFARPIRFELAPADLNAICRESVAAASAGLERMKTAVVVRADAALPAILTDAERLRIALVNVIVNAWQATEAHMSAAVAAAPAGAGGPEIPPVVVSTQRTGDRATVTISDRGGGIVADDLIRAFDPYFTTKRGGTGLGLPIAKNVIEGLGGTIVVASIPDGTEVRIDLPFARQEAR